MRRGSTIGRKKESSTEVWLGQKIAGPSNGMCSLPSTWKSHRKLNVGTHTLRATL